MDAPEKSAPQSSNGGILYWLKAMIGFLLALVGGLVTVVFAFILFAYLISRLGGARPDLSLFGLFNFWLLFGALPLGAAILLLKQRDGTQSGRTTRRALQWIFYSGCFLLVTVGVDVRFGPQRWHAAFRQEKSLVAKAESLKATVVSPHLEAAITKGNNVLWCGTFQLAWNEACALVGGDLHFDKDHEMVAVLNQRAFTKDSIDEASYVAMAGFTTSNIHEIIQNTVKEKFHGQFVPRFVPDKSLTPRPQDFVAYACLYKNLAFPVPFERLDDSLTFGGVKVRAFGIERHKASHEAMYPQVLVLDYQTEDDFVIELKTKVAGGRIILAKVQPQSRLGDTVAMVRERLKQTQAKPAARDDVLVVPRLDFDLTRTFDEIQGRQLVSADTRVAKDLRLLSAVQNTRFEMNEKGVELRSEAHTGFGCAREETPTPQHRMVFDKPFLLLLEREKARMPYFALWVDNPELLVPW